MPRRIAAPKVDVPAIVIATANPSQRHSGILLNKLRNAVNKK